MGDGEVFRMSQVADAGDGTIARAEINANEVAHVWFPFDSLMALWLFGDFDFGRGEDRPWTLVGGSCNAWKLHTPGDPSGVEDFSGVRRILWDGTEKTVCRSIKSRLESHSATFGLGSQRSDFEIFVEDFAASGVNNAGGGSKLLIGGGRDVFFSKIHEAAVLLQQG